MINIGLPQGNIREKSFQLIEYLLKRPVNHRKLHYVTDSGLSFYLLKHRDVPRLVNCGVLDIGITSAEWVRECLSSVVTVDAFDWCDTRISLLSPHGRPVLSANRSQITCATEFPNIAERFFQDATTADVRIEYVSGSSEGLVPDLFDSCIDCVQTGATANLHGLREEAIVYHSTVVMITREEEQARLQPVINLLSNVTTNMANTHMEGLYS